jgi:hypothetical protein
MKKRMENFGYRLKRARMKLKWNGDALATCFDLGSKVTVSRYEGEWRVPNWHMIRKLETFIRSVERSSVSKARSIYEPMLQERQRTLKSAKEVVTPPLENHTNAAPVVVTAPSIKLVTPTGENLRKKGGSVTFKEKNCPGPAEGLCNVPQEVPQEIPQGQPEGQRSENREADEFSILRTDGLCFVNGQPVFNFWKSLDPWKEGRELVMIKCEFCGQDTLPDRIQLVDGKRGAETIRDELAKFKCLDCINTPKKKIKDNGDLK